MLYFSQEDADSLTEQSPYTNPHLHMAVFLLAGYLLAYQIFLCITCPQTNQASFNLPRTWLSPYRLQRTIVLCEMCAVPLPNPNVCPSTEGKQPLECFSSGHPKENFLNFPDKKDKKTQKFLKEAKGLFQGKDTVARNKLQQERDNQQKPRDHPHCTDLLSVHRACTWAGASMVCSSGKQFCLYLHMDFQKCIRSP